jgi:hypothetical protein
MRYFIHINIFVDAKPHKLSLIKFIELPFKPNEGERISVAISKDWSSTIELNELTYNLEKEFFTAYSKKHVILFGDWPSDKVYNEAKEIGWDHMYLGTKYPEGHKYYTKE